MQFVRIYQGPLRKCQQSARLLSTFAPPKPVVIVGPPILNAFLRPKEKSAGSYYSRKMREGGMIPGIVYGTDDKKQNLAIRIMVPVKCLNKLVRERKYSFENTVQKLVLDDNSEYIVMARQLQLDPLSDSPLSVNFLLYRPGNFVRIPFTFENADASIDLKRGCFVTSVNRFIECVCTDDVPAFLTIDLTGKEKNDVIRVANLVFPPGCRPSRNVPADFVIAVIQAAKK